MALGRLWEVRFGRWPAVDALIQAQYNSFEFSSFLFFFHSECITCFKTCPLSFCCQIFQLGTSPAKFELGCQVCKLVSQVQSWQTSWKELVENIPKTLAAKLELGRPPPPRKHLGLFWREKITSSFLSRCCQQNNACIEMVP